MTTDNLQGKVAAIINERELAINIGADNGVKKGMKFKILSESQTEILDPESGAILGYVDREKIRVEVVGLQAKFSICRTYRTITTGYGWEIPAVFQGRVNVPETLRADKSAYLPDLSENESFVKKGDRAVLIES